MRQARNEQLARDWSRNWRKHMEQTSVILRQLRDKAARRGRVETTGRYGQGRDHGDRSR